MLRKALEFLKCSGEKHCHFQDGKAFVKNSESYWEYPIKEVLTGSCEIKKFLEILKHNEEFEIIVLPSGLQVKIQNLSETQAIGLEKAHYEQYPQACLFGVTNQLDPYFFKALNLVLPFSEENGSHEAANHIWFNNGSCVGTDSKILCEAFGAYQVEGLLPTKALKKLAKMKIKPSDYSEHERGFYFHFESGAFVRVLKSKLSLSGNYQKLFKCDTFESALRYRHFLTDQPEIKIGESTFETKLLKKAFDVAEYIGFSNGNLEFNGNGFRGILKGAKVEEIV
jgi:hypothetical protein